jgi:hypothetical protein
MFCAIPRDREIEILFRRLRLYDHLGRRAEGLVRTNQREMKERCGNARTIEMARREGGNSPWLNALAGLRQRAPREGHCFQHVQAITVATDQYAEKALGNCDYFLNKPYGVG